MTTEEVMSLDQLALRIERWGKGAVGPLKVEGFLPSKSHTEQKQEHGAGSKPAGKSKQADEWQLLATALDARGTLIRWSPPAHLDHRDMWTYTLTRSGYAAPNMDPEAERRLLSLPVGMRLEFIFDTGPLVNGIGHYLCRRWAGRCDLRRTVVTDLEIQDRAGQKAQGEAGAKIAAKAFEYAAFRFLEYPPDPRVVWQPSPDVADEAALFLAESTSGQSGHGSGQSNKKAGRDALLLRAARRALVEQTSQVARFFVVSDKDLARSALQSLPSERVILGYVSKTSVVGNTHAPILWFPDGGVSGGSLIRTGLVSLLWECLCPCDSVRLVRADNETLEVCAFSPGKNQFSYHWSPPRVYVKIAKLEESAQSSPKASTGSGQVEQASTSLPLEPKSRLNDGSTTLPPDEETSVVAKDVPHRIDWPLRELPKAADTVSVSLLPGVDTLIEATRLAILLPKNKSMDWDSLQLRYSTHRRVSACLRGIHALSDQDHAGPQKKNLVEIFTKNDLDQFSALFTGLKLYADVLDVVQHKKVLAQDDYKQKFGSPGASALSLMRVLGQVVVERRSKIVLDGSAFVDRKAFLAWFNNEFSTRARQSVSGEVRIAELADAALRTLRVSPFRFGLVLQVLLNDDLREQIVPATGGTPENILVEKVATLSIKSVQYKPISADCPVGGYRVLKKKS